MKCVGVLGGGQLARMLALAGHPLGVRLRVFDPTADAPAGAVAEHVRADWGDAGAIERFCDGLDAATLEFESVPIATARAIAARVRLAPSADAIGLPRSVDLLASSRAATAVCAAAISSCARTNRAGTDSMRTSASGWSTSESRYSACAMREA